MVLISISYFAEAGGGRRRGGGGGGPSCVPNQGQQCNCGPCGCGGTIQCNGACSGSNPTPSNYGQSCGNCGTINCAGQCVNQGPCSPGSTQCSGSRYQSCNSGCQWQNSGTNADNDAKDLQCGDSICDNSANVYDDTRTPTENACTDSLDSAKKDLTPIKSSTTNSQGSYSIANINCGTYNLVASHPGHAPQTKSNVPVNPQQQTISNFGGPGESGSSLVLGTSCEPDCTYASDNLVHASCDGKNGCTFFDSISKAACDNSQPGWFREYNSTHFITCASGSPQPNIEILASVSCTSGTLVKITRIVVYNGKPVKLVVTACG
ncbi:carboxypeptidase regulatory-like domain-containing protein [Candidatus Woesearchaeota archaeon]|nr:carboxypeptidase regulatory-like domain-containing protein [Candidatus Woesearchaeota archaeon]